MIKKIKAGAGLPFSKAVISDSKYVMELSGQVGLKDGKLAEGIEAQTEQCLENIKAVLAEQGWTLDNLIKVRIFLVDMADYGKVNEIYAKYFSEEFPARVALAVKGLPLGALIEIDCTAAREEIKG